MKMIYQPGHEVHLSQLGLVRYMHKVPFWRAVKGEGVCVDSNEGGSSYRVGEHLYVLAHDGTRYYNFIAPYFYAGVA